MNRRSPILSMRFISAIAAIAAIVAAVFTPSFAAESGKLPSQGTSPKAADIIKIDPPEQGFFAKKIDCLGVWIKAPAVVADEALLEAYRRIASEIGRNSGIRQNLTEAGAQLHIIGKDQVTSDLPYLRQYRGKPYDGKLTIDERTRGVGGLAASCGEENLLKLEKDRYKGRDICRHEFAHTILTYGADEAMREHVRGAYKKATDAGKWKDAYASSNFHEYFAELTMWYFGMRGHWGKNSGPEPQSGPEWLKSYDPDGYEMVDRIYSGRLKVATISRVDLKALPPEQEGKVRSGSENGRSSILFENQTGQDLQLFWLDQDGKRQRPDTLAAGDKDLVRTSAGHAWLVADKDGKAIGIYVARKEPGKVVVRLPSGKTSDSSSLSPPGLTSGP